MRARRQAPRTAGTAQVAERRRWLGRGEAARRAGAPPAVEAPPADYATLCDLARQALADGKFSEGAEVARQALGLQPRGLAAQRLLGLALLEAREGRQALSAFQAALACHPADLIAQTGVAEARELLGGPAEAEADWLRAWELAPGTPETEQRLRAARLAAGALDVTDGPPPLTRAALARIYLRGRLFEHAAAEARVVLAREPERPDVQLVLAEAHWRAGDGESAATVAGAMLDRHPDCVLANLLVAAYWQSVGRDIDGLLARIRAADPERAIAAQLFDDRDPPPLFGDEVPSAWTLDRVVTALTQAQVAVPPEPAIVEPQLPATVEPPELPAPELAVPAEAAAGETAPVVGGPAAAAQHPFQLEPEHAGSGEPILSISTAPLRGQTPPQRAVPAEQPPETRIEPAPALVATEASASMAEAVEAGSKAAPAAVPEETIREDAAPIMQRARSEGDAAMRERRYFDAVRAYGLALRTLRRAS